nr:uncharacterized protein LOC106783362 [Equus caballus]
MGGAEVTWLREAGTAVTPLSAPCLASSGTRTARPSGAVGAQAPGGDLLPLPATPQPLLLLLPERAVLSFPGAPLLRTRTGGTGGAVTWVLGPGRDSRGREATLPVLELTHVQTGGFGPRITLRTKVAPPKQIQGPGQDQMPVIDLPHLMTELVKVFLLNVRKPQPSKPVPPEGGCFPGVCRHTDPEGACVYCLSCHGRWMACAAADSSWERANREGGRRGTNSP